MTTTETITGLATWHIRPLPISEDSDGQESPRLLGRRDDTALSDEVLGGFVTRYITEGGDTLDRCGGFLSWLKDLNEGYTIFNTSVHSESGTVTAAFRPPHTYRRVLWVSSEIHIHEAVDVGAGFVEELLETTLASGSECFGAELRVETVVQARQRPPVTVGERAIREPFVARIENSADAIEIVLHGRYEEQFRSDSEIAECHRYDTHIGNVDGHRCPPT